MNILNMVIEILKFYWLDIVFVLLFIAFLIALWVKGYENKVKKIVFDMVVIAEKELGSGSGPIKFVRATNLIYSKLPLIVKIFLSDVQLDNLIKQAVEELKEYLKDDKVLLSYIEEKTIK